MTWYVYMVRCSDNSLYTGYTNDIKRRENAHNTGKGAKYTKSRRPVRLVYWEEFADRSDALKRECAIKKLTKQQKELLLQKESV